VRIPKQAGECPFPSVKALTAMVLADDDRAVRYVLAQLRENDGNVTATAKAIGVGARSLYVWRDSVARLREGFEKLAMGRLGAGIHATRARLAQADEKQGSTTRAAAKAPRKKAREPK
jgi:transposase-like protein